MDMPEYMRVRLYLYNLITKSDGKELRIPSENELCRLFNVSRITVRGAIHGLIKDNFLVARRGIGTFINPEKISKGSMDMPTVGIIVGDGRNVNNPIDPVVVSGISKSGMKFEIIFLTNSDSPERLIEIVKPGIDAVIWQNPVLDRNKSKYIESIHKSGIPLLIINLTQPVSIKSIDTIVLDTKANGIQLAEYLYANEHNDMLFVHNNSKLHLKKLLNKKSALYSFITKMEELAGNTSITTSVLSLIELKKKFKKSPDFLDNFNIIYSIAELAPYVMELLDIYSISVPEKISYLLYGRSEPCFFHNLEPSYIDKETALQKTVIEWLDMRLRKKNSKDLFERPLVTTIIPGETVLSK